MRQQGIKAPPAGILIGVVPLIPPPSTARHKDGCIQFLNFYHTQIHLMPVAEVWSRWETEFQDKEQQLIVILTNYTNWLGNISKILLKKKKKKFVLWGQKTAKHHIQTNVIIHRN